MFSYAWCNVISWRANVAKRALVLSGGGPVGIAWESGVVAGLFEQGVDLREADLIVGTSAGSVVGAQLALGREPASIASSHLAGQRSAAAARVTTERRDGAPDTTMLMTLMAKAAANGWSEAERLREMGKFALEAQTMDEETFIAGFGHRLASTESWPERDYRCTAVDAESGQFVVWDRSSGVPLKRAIASSCAVPGVYPPVTIGGRRYFDGGIRSGTSADVATGSEVVVILAIAGGGAAADDPRAELARRRLEGEIRVLREAGARTIELVAPDDESRAAFGLNMMDARHNQAAAENGVRQGREAAAALRSSWR